MLYRPKWSKAKKRLMSFLCDSLSSKVDYQVINYRGAHDQLGRAVITVDKVEKINMCTITAEREEYYRRRDIENNFGDNVSRRVIQEHAHEQLKKEGIYAQYDFFQTLEKYFNSSIEESLKSDDILIKILCLLDRRIGKRTLRKINEFISEEHTLVQEFYKLRCKAENLVCLI